jgi:tRNA(Ile)-lysidine synthase
MKPDLVTHVRKAIDRHRMLKPRDTVIAAISGGADSTALVVALLEIQDEYDISVEAAHVNHGLRGAESKRDEKHAVNLTRMLGLNVHVTHINVAAVAQREGLSLQEAGRKVRSDFFTKILSVTGAGKIATGHTRDDNVETFLMRLVSGSGPQGLSGISPYDPPYIRPLLDVPRPEIETFLRKRGIPWVEDSSNLSDAYTRNRIRSELVPRLCDINPRAQEHIAGAIARLQEMYASMEAAAEILASRARSGAALSVRELSGLPEGIQRPGWRASSSPTRPSPI